MGEEETMLNAWPCICVSRATVFDKEFRVLPRVTHCWWNSLQHDRAVVKILFKSVVCPNDHVGMCSSCNNQYSRAHDGTGRDTRGTQELLDAMHKQNQSSEILSKRKIKYSMHQSFVVCWNGSCRGAILSGSHGFGKFRSLQWILPNQSAVISDSSKDGRLSHHYKDTELHFKYCNYGDR